MPASHKRTLRTSGMGGEPSLAAIKQIDATALLIDPATAMVEDDVQKRNAPEASEREESRRALRLT